MKLSKLFYLLALVFTIAACGDDDSCSQSDWVGVYEGTLNCDGEPAEDVVLTITASGADALVISYVASSIETEYDPLTYDACSISRTASAGGVTQTVDMTLDGDKITLKENLSSGSTSFGCDINASRK